MAKKYKLVTTLSDGTEINAGTFEVPDASGAVTYYQHNIKLGIDTNSSLKGGGVVFFIINTNSSKIVNYDDVLNVLPTSSAVLIATGFYDTDSPIYIFGIRASGTNITLIHSFYNNGITAMTLPESSVYSIVDEVMKIE